LPFALSPLTFSVPCPCICLASALQELLLERGMLGFVVPLLLAYDTTHSNGSQQQQGLQGLQGGLQGLQQQEQQMPGPDEPAAILRLPLQRVNAQATKNLHAQLAVRALAALAGYPAPSPTSADGGADGDSQAPPAEAAVPADAVLPAEPTPACPAAQRALAALLTATLAPRLAQPDPLPLLRDLTSSLQTAQVIWNGGMRQELLEQLQAQRAAALAGEPAAAAVGAAKEVAGFSYKVRALACCCMPAAYLFAASPAACLLLPQLVYLVSLPFVPRAIHKLSTSDTHTPNLPPARPPFLQCLRGELLVAGVFVRVYTEQPDSQLSDPAAFCKALVTYIYQQQAAGTAGVAAAREAAAEAPAEQGEEQSQQQRRRHLLQALRALQLVLEGSPRLLGLLATKPAVDPLLSCLRPACTAGLPGAEADAARLAASPPAWVQEQQQQQGMGPSATASELEVAELALTVLLRLTAHAGALPGCKSACSHSWTFRLQIRAISCQPSPRTSLFYILCCLPTCLPTCLPALACPAHLPAGCIEALSQDKCIIQAFWLAHRAPNTGV
jgi:DnaJ family protein C protein 13